MKTLKVFRIPAILAVTFIACGDDEPEGPTPGSQSPWKLVFTYNAAENDSIEDMWFSSANDGWACMYKRVFHYDGVKWRLFADLGQQLGATALTDISAAGPNDVWVGGSPEAGAHFYHYNGTKWDKIDTHFPIDYVNDIFFISPNQGWAAVAGERSPGNQGMVLFYDGQNWTCQWNSETEMEELFFVNASNGWGYGFDRNYDRHLYHFDGEWWDEVQLPGPPAEYFEAIKFCGPQDGWLLARNGTNPKLYHYDGAAWTVVECPANAKYVYEADFASATDGWLAGGTSWHYDGQKFTAYPWPYEDQEANAIWVCGENDVWAATGGLGTPNYIYHFTGFN